MDIKISDPITKLLNSEPKVPLAQRAIALVLKLLDLGKVCQDLVLNLRSKFKVRDDTLGSATIVMYT